jgi:hypothetical protein
MGRTENDAAFCLKQMNFREKSFFRQPFCSTTGAASVALIRVVAP